MEVCEICVLRCCHLQVLMGTGPSRGKSSQDGPPSDDESSSPNRSTEAGENQSVFQAGTYAIFTLGRCRRVPRVGDPGVRRSLLCESKREGCERMSLEHERRESFRLGTFVVEMRLCEAPYPLKFALHR